MALTNKQYEVLDYIKKFIATKGYSPTVREVQVGMNLKSPASASDYIKKLVLNGCITVDKKKSRTIELLVVNEYIKNDEDEVTKVPLIGKNYKSKPKKFMTIPIYMLNDFVLKNIYAFKEGKSIYLICTDLTLRNRPSVVVKNDELVVEEDARKDIFGNIISEFKIY